MMFPRRQRLRNHRVPPARKMDDGGEVIVQFRMVGPLRAGGGVDGHRVARAGEIPAGQVEKVDRLFEDPVAHAIDIVPPAIGALPVGMPPEFDQCVERIANRAGFDQFLHLAPKRRHPQFVADRKNPLARERAKVDQLRAIRERSVPWVFRATRAVRIRERPAPLRSGGAREGRWSRVRIPQPQAFRGSRHRRATVGDRCALWRRIARIARKSQAA